MKVKRVVDMFSGDETRRVYERGNQRARYSRGLGDVTALDAYDAFGPAKVRPIEICCHKEDVNRTGGAGCLRWFAFATNTRPMISGGITRPTVIRRFWRR